MDDVAVLERDRISPSYLKLRVGYPTDGPCLDMLTVGPICPAVCAEDERHQT